MDQVWVTLMGQAAGLLLAVGTFVSAWITSTSKRRRIENVKLAAETRRVLTESDDRGILDRFIRDELTRLAAREAATRSRRGPLARDFEFTPGQLVAMGMVILAVVLLSPLMTYRARMGHWPDAEWWGDSAFMFIIAAVLIIGTSAIFATAAIRRWLRRRGRGGAGPNED